MRKLNFLVLTGLILLNAACKKSEQTSLVNGQPKSSKPVTLGSAAGDVVGKLTVGYQGWFLAAGDGSKFNSFQHTNLEAWPDTRQYTTTYGNVQFNQAGVLQPPFTGTLNNGQPARMFSNWDQSTVNLHFSWMQQNGIDCVALQRFIGHISDPRVLDQINGVATRVKNAAEQYGRKFYMMYDCSATDPLQSDWNTNIVNLLHITSSPSYAQQNGKPVICFYGIGKSDRGATADWINTINTFKNMGFYVIGAVQGNFTSGNYLSAVNACDMIMSWMVGRSNNTNFQSVYTTELNYCNSNNLDYQADIFPGFAYSNSNTSKPQNEIKRMHGDFMWSQFAGAKTAGVPSVYVSMFDEANEATSIFNCAEDNTMIPAGKYFYTLDADGTHVTSDFYLRLTNDGGKMIKGQIPFTATHPTPHTFTPPSSLTPHVLSNSSIQINWSAVTGAPCYNLKRSLTHGGPYSTVVSGYSGGGFTDTGLSPNTTYYYVVTTGRYNASESVISTEVNGKTTN